MKLRNKKTGEIITCGAIDTLDLDMGSMKYFRNYGYSSLAELNEDWEDYEEPKGWYLDSIGKPIKIAFGGESFKQTLEAVGNYFETKEEAERAVEKLKAWKRLKELGFRFIGNTCDYKSDKHFGSVFFETNGYALDVYEDTIELYDDLDLLFGGEE